MGFVSVVRIYLINIFSFTIFVFACNLHRQVKLFWLWHSSKRVQKLNSPFRFVRSFSDGSAVAAAKQKIIYIFPERERVNGNTQTVHVHERKFIPFFFTELFSLSNRMYMRRVCTRLCSTVHCIRFWFGEVVVVVVVDVDYRFFIQNRVSFSICARSLLHTQKTCEFVVVVFPQ